MKLKSSKIHKTLLIARRSCEVLLTALIIVLMFPTKSSFKYEFSKGQFWKHENLISPIDFAIKKTDAEIANDKAEIERNKKLFFIKDTAFENSTIREFEFKNENSLDPKALKFITDNIKQLYSIGILQNIGENTQNDIVLLENNVAQEYESDAFLTLKQATEEISQSIKSSKLSNKDELIKIITDQLKANLRLDKDITEQVLATKMQEITNNKGLIYTRELIISRGEQITEEKFQILSSLKEEYEGQNISKTKQYTITLGQFLLVVIALTAMMLFINHSNKEAYQDNRKITLILFVILFMSLIVASVLQINPKYIYTVPLCLTPIIIRTFFNTKTALYVFLVSIIIIGFAVPNSFEFVFYQLIAGMMAIVSIEHSDKRSNFLLTSLFIFVSYALIYIATSLLQNMDLNQLEWQRFLMFALNAILILFAVPFVIMLEKMFHLLSDFSLIGYTNTNTKILRELSSKAPGTFQHCIQVANIAEDLIHEIGGNAMLARAGALHHDIGKIMTPMFFVENQNTGFNPHSEITYEESAQVIISHVTNGVKIAKKYGLPEQIIDFIRTHHGTSKTKFFYNKQLAEFPDSPIDEQAFTYRGPRPFSRETAVVMMVDSVEAASRSLKNHSEEVISKLVDGIIDSQIADDQFSNSDITFRDVNKIKAILKKKLQSIYHVRVEYPVNVVKNENKQ
ncbi:MAG: HDIG domain-containing protein [Bacteroidales bacterium]|nr:HDIG domain-containing protein [Bacteroidales bacterium]